MRLTSKLLGWLSRAFDRDPQAVLGLRLDYAGSMQWTVSDGVLTTVVSGGPGHGLTIDLTGYTVRTLADYLGTQVGYTVPYVATADISGGSALRLLEATGSPQTSNGDHLYIYTSPLYALMDGPAVELAAAEAAIGGLAAEMSTQTANGGWLDYLASFYAVPRQTGEQDGVFSARIVAEVLRPLGNNLAIEQAIEDFTGQSVSIVDVVQYNAPQPRFDGTPKFDGTYHFQTSAQAVYGLFDAIVGYDLLGGDAPALEATRLRAMIERLRDAGTQLRALSLGGSVLLDQVSTPPNDSADTLVITHRRQFDGSFRFDGSIMFEGPTQETGTIASTGSGVPISIQANQVQIGAGGVTVPDGNGGTMPLLISFYG